MILTSYVRRKSTGATFSERENSENSGRPRLFRSGCALKKQDINDKTTLHELLAVVLWMARRMCLHCAR